MAGQWFEVIADRFDWSPRRGYMISYRRGYVGYGTRACVAHGLRVGAVKRIQRPEGWSVDKSGRVRRGR